MRLAKAGSRSEEPASAVPGRSWTMNLRLGFDWAIAREMCPCDPPI